MQIPFRSAATLVAFVVVTALSGPVLAKSDKNDPDHDGWNNNKDNCAEVYNPDQADTDGDGIGEVCDDDDGDSVYNTGDNCPAVANSDQSDADADGAGDACDADGDGDGRLNFEDNCPATPNADQADLDADGAGDACDADDDGDLASDGTDNCPVVANPDQADRDGDGLGDACDADGDGDEVADGDDNCPVTPNADQTDADGDGTGDACDPLTDSDADGVGDATDNCPSAANPDQADADGDGTGDACDALTDSDGDGVGDAVDNCPATANADQADTDGDGIGNACDTLTDTDGDGVADSSDNCPGVANTSQADSDGDGIGDACDTVVEKTACEKAYEGFGTDSQALAPPIPIGGEQALILSFADDAGRDQAARALRDGVVGARDAATLHAYRNLPILTFTAHRVTPELLDGLRVGLRSSRLGSIRADGRVPLMLDSSTAYIDVPQARQELGVTGAGIGVAIIDSGVDTTQGDFGNAVDVRKFVGPVAIATPDSDTTSGHGTHVAGIVGGTGASSSGLWVGVAPDAALLGYGTGDGSSIHIASALSAYDRMLDVQQRYNVRVTNNSYGGAGAFDRGDPIMVAVKRAYDRGIVSVFAAGNNLPAGGTHQFTSYGGPCSITVANGDRAGFLNSSSSIAAPNSTYVPTITAPGTAITSARGTTGAIATPRKDNPRYAIMSGTSMASPHVAGVIALMQEAALDAGRPPLGLEAVVDIFQRTATPMVRRNGTAYPRNEAGFGYVNAHAAAALAAGQPLPPNRDKIPTVDADHPATFRGTSARTLIAGCFGCEFEGGTAYSGRHKFRIPAGIEFSQVSATLTWETAAEKLDLALFAPDGRSATTVSRFTDTRLIEAVTRVEARRSVTLADPVDGIYELRVSDYVAESAAYRIEVAVACDGPCVIVDDDGDGVANAVDNCPAIPNAGQEDADGDGVGDACDGLNDGDGDGVADAEDNCPAVANADQANHDTDAAGDACDADDDGDGVNDGSDAFPLDPAESVDTDGDGTGNNADGDDDGDTVADGGDNCPLVANADQADGDGDGLGDACDLLGGTTTYYFRSPADGFFITPIDQAMSGAGILSTALPPNLGYSHGDDNSALVSTTAPSTIADIVFQTAGNVTVNGVVDAVVHVESDGNLLHFLDCGGLDARLWVKEAAWRELGAVELDLPDGVLPFDQLVLTGSFGQQAASGVLAITLSASSFDCGSNLQVLFDDVDYASRIEVVGGGGGGSNDADGDGVANGGDNCPLVANPAQANNYGTSAGDACEDTDGDGTVDASDAFPLDATETMDADGDGTGDNADACPLDPTPDCSGGGDTFPANGHPDVRAFYNALVAAAESGAPVTVPTVKIDTFLGFDSFGDASAVALVVTESSMADGAWFEVNGKPRPDLAPWYRIFEGRVQGEANSIAHIVVARDFVRGAVRRGDTVEVIRIRMKDGTLRNLPVDLASSAVPTEPSYVPAQSPEPSACPADYIPLNDFVRAVPPYLSPNALGLLGAPRELTSRVILDADYDAFRRWGWHAPVMMVAMLAEMDMTYRYEVGVHHKLVGVHLNLIPGYYKPVEPQAPFPEVSRWWDTHHAGERDIVHLFTGHTSTYAQANCIGSTGTSAGYSFTPIDWEEQYAVFHENAFAHEFGHLYSAHHHYGNHVESELGTIMIQGYTPGAQPQFGSLEKSVIRGWAEEYFGGGATVPHP